MRPIPHHEAKLVAAKSLAALFGALSHPHRVQILRELAEGERDVNTLQEALGCSHSRVSQHLSVLRLHRLVTERREGRHVIYRLVSPELAHWMLEGLTYLEAHAHELQRTTAALAAAREAWDRNADETSPGEMPAIE